MSNKCKYCGFVGTNDEMEKHAGEMCWEQNYEKFVEECAKECLCCPECWEVPCGGCLAGGVCDNICFCHEKEYEETFEQLIQGI
jgi:hypothetical protein